MANQWAPAMQLPAMQPHATAHAVDALERAPVVHRCQVELDPLDRAEPGPELVGRAAHDRRAQHALGSAFIDLCGDEEDDNPIVYLAKRHAAHRQRRAERLKAQAADAAAAASGVVLGPTTCAHLLCSRYEHSGFCSASTALGTFPPHLGASRVT